MDYNQNILRYMPLKSKIPDYEYETLSLWGKCKYSLTLLQNSGANSNTYRIRKATHRLSPLRQLLPDADRSTTARFHLPRLHWPCSLGHLCLLFCCYDHAIQIFMSFLFDSDIVCTHCSRALQSYRSRMRRFTLFLRKKLLSRGSCFFHQKRHQNVFRNECWQYPLIKRLT